jgi:hypothetical protein
MSNSLICYVEKEELLKVTNEVVIQRFMTMKPVDLMMKIKGNVLLFFIGSSFSVKLKLSHKSLFAFFRYSTSWRLEDVEELKSN